MSEVETKKEFELRDHISAAYPESYFVKAGAGAGKTFMVVSRIINQLAKGIKPEELVVITFTEKAAQELLERILLKVVEAANKPGLDEIARNNLEKAKDNIDRMQVSTIHAFCNKLITEQIFSAKIPMGLNLLVDDELTLTLEEFFNVYYLLDYDKVERAERLWGKSPRTMIQKTFMSLCFIDKDTEVRYDHEVLEDEQFEDKLEQELTNIKSSLVDIYNKYIGGEYLSYEELPIDTFLNKGLKDAINGNDYESLYKCLAVGEKLINKRTLKGENNDYATAELLKASEPFNELGKRITARKVAAIVDYADLLRQEYLKQRDEHKDYLTNDDLLKIACDLVFEKEAWEFYHHKFKCFYVDEFQDTDHIQAKMILKLCAKSFDNDELVEDKLVVVGDAKQSIYRFRGADLNEYNRIEGFYQAQNNPNVRIEELAFNFRSGEHVINWVNNNFRNVIPNYMDMKYSQTEKRQKAILNASKVSGYQDNLLVDGVYYINSGNKFSVENDAELLGNLINNMVGKYFIFDKEKETFRKIQYKDFLILNETTTDMTKYVDTLINKGIPVSLAGKVDVGAMREFHRFARLYSYLSQYNPDDASIEAIIQNEVNDLARRFKITKSDALKIKQEIKGYDGAALAIYLSHNLQYILDCNVVIQKERMMMIQARIQQMVEKVVSETENNPHALAQAFFDYLEADIGKELALADGMDCVRLMNVHKSKGLEGAIVIIAHRKKKTRERASELRGNDGDKYYINPVVKNGEFNQIGSYVGDSKLEQQAKNEEGAEKVRLEYVAATRAQQALIIMPSDGDSFMSSYLETPPTSDGQLIAYNNGIKLPIYEASVEQNEQVREYHSPWTVGVSANQKLRKEFEVTPSSKELKRDFEDSEYANGRPCGAVFGTIMHRCFELIAQKTFKKEAFDRSLIIRQAINEEISRLTDSCKIDRTHYDIKKLQNRQKEYFNYLNQKMSNFEKSALLMEIKQAQIIYTELPFFMNEEDTLVHGFADLVIVNNDGSIKIVDYKSDALLKDESLEGLQARLNRQYAPQLKLYKDVVCKLFNKQESEVTYFIYSIELN